MNYNKQFTLKNFNMLLLFKYLKKLISIHLDIIKYILNKVEINGTNDIACLTRNLKIKVSGGAHRFRFDSSKNIFFLEDNFRKHYFGNRHRGFFLYTQGLDHRRDSLANSYCLEKINLVTSF